MTNEMDDKAAMAQLLLARLHAQQELYPKMARMVRDYIQEHGDEMQEVGASAIEPAIWIQGLVGIMVNTYVDKMQALPAFQVLVRGLARQLGLEYEEVPDEDGESPSLH